MAEPRVPALVVSGFLGSGKTTLVSGILEEARRSGARVALVSNELGELGVDRAILGAGGQAYVELEGGCVCCELSDDLVRTLEELHRRVSPDRIVIETSGAALPFDTQLNFWRDPVRRWIGGDMAVVVVDAEQVLEERDLPGLFSDQVRSADLLVLNKVDLVPEARLETVVERLRAIEPEAPIVCSVRGDVDSALFFPPETTADQRSGEPPAAPPHHHERFATSVLCVEPDVAPARLEALLRDPSLLRAKGFVRTSQGLRLVQVVGRRVELEEVEKPPDSSLVGRVVLIRRLP